MFYYKSYFVLDYEFDILKFFEIFGGFMKLVGVEGV